MNNNVIIQSGDSITHTLHENNMDNLITHQKNESYKHTHSEDSTKNNKMLSIENSKTKNYTKLSQKKWSEAN